MIKLIVPPLGFVVVGVNAYTFPTTAVVAGAPLIVGGGTDITLIVKGASVAVPVPSYTAIVMLAKVPMLAALGVPQSCPVVESNVAHDGRFCTEKLKIAPRGLDAAGVNV
jgi:hypothetical protein